MRWRVILVAAFALLSTGCGEVETLVLPARPNLADFDQVQTALITAGCSANGACHTALVGNFQLTPLPKAPNIREAEFQLTKQFLRLDNPDESSLLRVALRGDPESEGHAVCFDTTENCVYQKVLSWISAGSPSDPGPADIDCVPEPSCP